MDFVAVGMFQAVGHGRSALAFAILRMIVLSIASVVMLNRIFKAGKVQLDR